MKNNVSSSDKERAKSIRTAEVLHALGLVKSIPSKATFNICCPYHQDRTPSCTVYAHNIKCHSTSCPTHGTSKDNIALVMDFLGLGFVEAVQWLLTSLCGGYVPTVAAREDTPPLQTGEPLDYTAYREELKAYYGNEFAHGFSPLLKYLSDLAPQYSWVSSFMLYECGYSNGFERFPYRDKHGTLHQIKCMKYDNNGHRLKIGHCPLYIEKHPDYICRTMLFGAHLITDDTNVIYVVESEKTALICSVVQPCAHLYGEGVWVATGGAENFKCGTYENNRYDKNGNLLLLGTLVKRGNAVDKMMNYKGKTIVLVPDIDARQDWRATAVELAMVGHEVNFVDIAKVLPPDSKMDIADYVVSELGKKRILSPSDGDTGAKVTNTPPTTQTPVREDLNSVFGVHAYLCRTNSGYAQLCDTLDLQPIAIDRV